MVQLTLSPAPSGAKELECSFLKNIHFASVLLTCDKESKMAEVTRHIEGGIDDEPKKVIHGTMAKIFSCHLCLGGFMKKKRLR